MPENLPGDPAATVPVPLRYLRRNRKVVEWSGDLTDYYTKDETILQWRGPDGVWRDVPTLEEGKESDEGSKV